MLSVSEHPDDSSQLPKGTVEVDEPIGRAAVRELEEESGVTDVRLVFELPPIERPLPSGPTSDGPLEDQVWHVFLFEPCSELPESWRHVLPAGPTETGLTFSYRWIPLSTAQEILHPLFAPVSEALLHPENEQGLRAFAQGADSDEGRLRGHN